jgi:hypothetical protein
MDFIIINKEQEWIDIYEDQPGFCYFKFKLDDIGADPVKAAEVPREELEPMLIQVEAVKGALSARLAITAVEKPAQPNQGDDRLLTAGEAAKILNVTPRWLYSHWKKLPFSRRISRKCLRFREAELLKYIKK